ncbi:MAG TPA: LpqB family beta-propeller domain-containing protein [Streptosporangiaceae bacterium]
MAVSARWRAGAAAALAAVLLSACATIPGGGVAQSGQLDQTSTVQGQDYPQLIPVPPGPNWNPEEIVSGFLAASASFTGGHAVAREYLVPPQQLSQRWQPGWAVRVVSALKLQPIPVVPPHETEPGVTYAEVQATGEQQLATLTQTGQYVRAQSTSSPSIDFQLVKVNGGPWRITNPPNQLLLTKTDFQGVYAQRNLYFLSGSGRALVPDPVFVPLQASPADLANQLVTALRANPQGWLEGAAQTAFPHDVRVQVAINAGTVAIDLNGPASAVSKKRLGEMTSQLIWTLANGLPAVQAVHLEINGKLGGSATWSGGQPKQTGGPPVTVPVAHTGASLYSIGAGGAVQKLTGPLSRASRVPGEAGEGRVPLTTIAVSPDGHYVAGLTKVGSEVYYAAINPGARFRTWSHSGGFTSVSWDVYDNLWLAGPRGVWEVPAGGSPVPVNVDLRGSLTGYQVQQFRVAPDGVRAAMIVTVPGGGGAELRIGAIVRTRTRVSVGAIVRTGTQVSVGLGQAGQPETIGTGVSDAVQLTWYDAENLIVLSQSPTLGPQLDEVPVNGGSSSSLITDIHTSSLSAAGPENQIVAGLSDGKLASTSALNGNWSTISGAGSSPTYPG